MKAPKGGITDVIVYESNLVSEPTKKDGAARNLKAVQ